MKKFQMNAAEYMRQMSNKEPPLDELLQIDARVRLGEKVAGYPWSSRAYMRSRESDPLFVKHAIRPHRGHADGQPVCYDRPHFRSPATWWDVEALACKVCVLYLFEQEHLP